MRANGEHRAASPAVLLHRALDVLETLAGSGTPLSLAEIAERVSVPKPTVHRLLTTLAARGYVTQDARTARYAAGVGCLVLGSSWARNLDLRSVAQPHLARLNRETGETVHLGVYDHGDVVYVEKLDSPRQVIAQSRLGARAPAGTVSTGRALLAFQSQGEVDDVLSRPLPVFTGASIQDPGELARCLAEVRRLGYAVNHGSYRDDVGGLAAPIRDHTGAVVAAVGVCLPEYRFGPDRLPVLAEATVAAAVAISCDLGVRVAAPSPSAPVVPLAAPGGRG